MPEAPHTTSLARAHGLIGSLALGRATEAAVCRGRVAKTRRGDVEDASRRRRATDSSAAVRRGRVAKTRRGDGEDMPRRRRGRVAATSTTRRGDVEDASRRRRGCLAVHGVGGVRDRSQRRRRGSGPRDGEGGIARPRGSRSTGRALNATPRDTRRTPCGPGSGGPRACRLSRPRATRRRPRPRPRASAAARRPARRQLCASSCASSAAPRPEPPRQDALLPARRRRRGPRRGASSFSISVLQRAAARPSVGLFACDGSGAS